MTTAAKQFFRDFASVIYDGASATLRVALKTLGVVGMSIPALFFIGVIVWAFMTAPSPTPEQKAAEEAARLEEEAARLNRQARDPVAERQKTQLKQELCHEAKACKKYSEARLECATAGNFKPIIHIPGIRGLMVPERGNNARRLSDALPTPLPAALVCRGTSRPLWSFCSNKPRRCRANVRCSERIAAYWYMWGTRTQRALSP